MLPSHKPNDSTSRDDTDRLYNYLVIGAIAFGGVFLFTLLVLGVATSFSFISRATANYVPYDPSQPIHIAWWTSNPYNHPHLPLYISSPLSFNLSGLRTGIPFTCIIEPDKEQAAASTDAILIAPMQGNKVNLPASFPPRFEHQLWVYVSADTPTFQWSLGNDPALLSLIFNLTMTPSVRSDISHVHLNLLDNDPIFRGSLMPIFENVPLLARNRAFLFIDSDCNDQKLSHLKHLLIHFQIHSYGSCNHNQDTLIEQLDFSDPAHIALVSSYAFFLIFPTTPCYDEIPHVYWHLLRLGTLPVYIGPLNVGIFEPVPDFLSAIDTSKPLHSTPRAPSSDQRYTWSDPF